MSTVFPLPTTTLCTTYTSVSSAHQVIYTTFLYWANTFVLSPILLNISAMTLDKSCPLQKELIVDKRDKWVHRNCKELIYHSINTYQRRCLTQALRFWKVTYFRTLLSLESVKVNKIEGKSRGNGICRNLEALKTVR